MYSDKVMDHFKNPRNMGEMRDADVLGEVSNPTCGDLMYIYLKIGLKEGKEVIEDISFQTFGCAAAIATSSMITMIAKGKTLDDATKITREDVANSLDGLPPLKMHCSNLAADALREAIKNYRMKQKQ